MAISPAQFAQVVEKLGTQGLLQEKDGYWRRVVIEKPFGYDLHSARELQERLLRHLREEQIFRIDHYLGKTMVQSSASPTPCSSRCGTATTSTMSRSLTPRPPAWARGVLITTVAAPCGT